MGEPSNEPARTGTGGRDSGIPGPLAARAVKVRAMHPTASAEREAERHLAAPLLMQIGLAHPGGPRAYES